MPNSLKARLGNLRYKKIISDKDYDRLCKALEQETKTSHWVKHDTGHNVYYDCFLCGCVAPCTETADAWLWKLSNYCPDCGARMIKSQESEENNEKSHNRDS